MKKRLMMVDPQKSVREMLGVILAQRFSFEVVAETSSGLEALELCRRQKPDLVIAELALPEVCGTEVLRRIRLARLGTRTLIYSGVTDPLRIRRALIEKPHGFVSKADPLATVLQATRTVMEGGVYVSAALTGSWHCAPPETDASASLTEREREVLQMVAEGQSSKEIAARLSLSRKTVENHRSHVMDKLNLHNVAALTRFAVQHGIPY